MRELERQQSRFQESVLSGDFPEELLQRRGGRCARLEIYQHAYRARLIDALVDNYPALHRALGDEAFEDLAAAYIAARPSRYRSIRWFGDGLADFVAEERERLPPLQTCVAVVTVTVEEHVDQRLAFLLGVL